MTTPTAQASWAGTAAAYSQSFERLCRGTHTRILSELLSTTDRPGRLMDVGTGPGSFTFAAAQAGFNVLGVDADSSMVDLAHRRHPQLKWVRAALPQLPVADTSVDAATANFVVNHCPDPLAAVRELYRIITVTGTAAITIWPNTVSPLNHMWNSVIAAAGVPTPPGKSLPAERDFPRTVTGLGTLVEGACFHQVQVHELHWTFDIRPDDLWAAVTAGIATVGTVYLAQSPERRRAMATAYEQLCTATATDGHVKFPTTALLAVGTR